MTPLLYAPLLLALLLVNVSAQSGDNLNLSVWAVVAFVNHGEKTPSLGGLQTILTPTGAQQMFRQGTAFRSRYLTGGNDGNTSVANSTVPAIQNIARDAIDNSQLTILSQTDEWVAGGAMAFLQGLYPPAIRAFNSPAGGQQLAHDFVPGSIRTYYPLGGYQYPNIQTLSTTSPASVALQGTVGCSAWDSKANTTEEKDLADRFTTTQGFYQSLFSTAPLEGTTPLDQTHYGNAYDIYEFVNYMNTHNETVFKGLQNANDTLYTLRSNAFEIERTKNSINTTLNVNDTSNVVSSIAGHTLAMKVADSFSSVAQGNGSKLTLMFGSLEPLLAFFSIGGLFTRQNLLSGPFSTLPEPGAAMIFELIGQNPDDPASMPTAEDLMVRFLYRATADGDEPFPLYPLFNSDFDGHSIPYTGFLSAMQRLGQNSSQWCDLCNPTAAPWCQAPSSTRRSLKPGYVVTDTLVVAAITLACVAIYMLVIRHAPLFNFNKRSNAQGGFKGAEKKASDIDVITLESGMQHARIGSWELRDGGSGPSTGSVGIVTTDLDKESLSRPRQPVDDDGISLTDVVPVKARESV